MDVIALLCTIILLIDLIVNTYYYIKSHSYFMKTQVQYSVMEALNKQTIFISSLYLKNDKEKAQAIKDYVMK